MRARRWGMAAAAIGVALLLSGAQGLWAERLYRPMLSGDIQIFGWYLRLGSGGSMIYPNNVKRPGGYGENTLYGGVEYGAYYMWQNFTTGFWTLTSNGKVIYTAPRHDKDALSQPMLYDVSVDPDLSRLGKQYYQHRVPTVAMGLGQRFPNGSEETSLGGNWYPGSDIIKQWTSSGAKNPIHVMNFNLAAYPTYDEWPEEVIVLRWTNAQGLTVTRRVHGWSHPDFDDLYIDDYEVENTGDTNGDGKRDLPEAAQNDLYMGFMDRFAPSAAGAWLTGAYWEDEAVHTGMHDDWYAYDEKLKLLSVWDGDHPLYRDWDDTGDPYKDAFAFKRLGQPENTLMSPSYVGVGVLAYTDDPSSPYRFNARDRGKGYVAPKGDQPYAVRYWGAYNQSWQDDPRGQTMSDAQIYSAVVGGGRQVQAKPTSPSGQFSMLLFGPYDLPPGGKTKIVLAYVAGHPGQVLGNTDMWTWAFKGNQAELPKGLDAQKQNIAAAHFAYDNAYDIPDAPPDVNFRTNSSPDATMQCEWPDEVENAAHPDYAGSSDAKDIAGYRVYRSTWFDVGPYALVGEVKAGQATETLAYKVERRDRDYVFTDKTSVAGFNYNYSVRAYAKPHKTWSPGNPNSPLDMAKLPAHIAQRVQVGQEGGYSAQTQRIYASESPFAVPTAKSEASEAQVRVVPNPYIGSGWSSVPGASSHSYAGTTKIRFVGIPSRARIIIFSVSGELVSDYTQIDPSKGESSYDQLTWTYSGEIATGVYFYVVQNLIEGPNKGKLQRGTFMVIR